MKTVDTSNAEHYSWGKGCDGWHLLKQDNLSVIEECVPPREREKRHLHNYSRQFFYILQGEAVIEIDGSEFILREQQGIEVPPRVPHQFRNESGSEVRFLVVSVPKSHGDWVITAL